MITAVQEKDLYIIRFPYDTEVIRLIKNVPGWRWVNDKKYWTIPVARLGFLIVQFQGTPYEHQLEVYSDERIDENATLDDTASIPDIDISDVTYQVEDGLFPLPHQLDFMRYSIYRQHQGLHSGFILADQPGLAKTNQTMNLALYNRQFNHIKHCLVIVCQNSAKYNWIEDIRKHTNGLEVPYLLGQRRKRNGDIRMEGSSLEKLEDLKCGHMYGDSEAPELPFFIVMNIEAIRMISNRHYWIREHLTQLVNSGYIGMIAIDECHKGMSPTSKQGKQILQLKKDIRVNLEWIPITGTPIVNKPTDVFLPLKLVDGHTCRSYYDWCQHFCVYGGFGDHQIIAYKNIPELKSMLQENMLRRLKSKVLDLPPKIHTIEYVENTPYQEKLYDGVLREVISHKDEIVSSANPMVKFLKLRQVNGSPELIDNTLDIDDEYLTKNSKLIRLLDLVDTIVSGGEKVVVFSNWVEPLRTIYKYLNKDYKVCCFTGTMKPEVREQHKKAFQDNPDYKIMIGTVDALGVSHTFTCANNVIFYDLPWNPATMEQAEDRCHRVGTVKTLNIYSIITRGTVDERVYNLIMQKDGMSKYIVDNEFDFKTNPQLFEYLLGHKS